MTRRYTFEIATLLGPDRDIPAPDVNTDERVMAWLLDTLDMFQGRSMPAGVVTGKPLAVGGMRAAHRGHGVRAWSGASGPSSPPSRCALAGARAIVQGFGKVGGPLVFLLSSAGMRVVAVSDVGGACLQPGRPRRRLAVRPRGPDRARWRGSTGARRSAAPTSGRSTPNWPYPPPSRVPSTSAAAKALKASVVVEAANGPTTPEADQVLAERGITVVPDILANAGGVTASYFEWAQSRQGYAWDEELVATRLARTIDDAFVDVWARSRRLGVTMRRAAGVVAIDRLAAAITAQRPVPVVGRHPPGAGARLTPEPASRGSPPHQPRSTHSWR